MTAPPFTAVLPKLGKQPMPKAAAAPLASLTTDVRHIQRVERRRHVELTQGTAAVTAIGTLPEPGTVTHYRMDGSFNGVDVLLALIELLSPATVTMLYAATLSFNPRVAQRILDAIDAGKVAKCLFVSSALFFGKERGTVSAFSAALEARGCSLKSPRNHCKLLLLKTTDGRHLVIESSANLRTCRCWEQFTLTDDAATYHWHARFLEEIA